MSEYSANFLTLFGLSLLFISAILISYTAAKRIIDKKHHEKVENEKQEIALQLVTNSMNFTAKSEIVPIKNGDKYLIAKVFTQMVAILTEEDALELVSYAKRTSIEPMLVQFASANREEYRISACKTLKHFRHRADTLLRIAKTDKSQRVRIEALISLANSYKRPKFEDWSQWIALASPSPNIAIKSILENTEYISNRMLSRLLHNSNCSEILKIWILNEISKRDPKQADRDIERLLHTQDLSTSFIASMIQSIGSAKSLISISGFAFNSNNWQLKSEIAKAAAKLLAYELLNDVMKLINDKDYRVHIAAREATKILAGVGDNPDPRKIRHGKSLNPFLDEQENRFSHA